MITLPDRCFAIIRFSGIADDENIKQHTDELKTYILAETLKPILAFYNPPWTITFLRRNELMIEIGVDR